MTHPADHNHANQFDPTRHNPGSQYADASNLNARTNVHRRFSSNGYGWPRWVFDQFHFAPAAEVLELGCGDGGLWVSNRSRIEASWRIVLSDDSEGMLAEARKALGDFGLGFAFEVIDAQAIPHEDARFDAVVANHMLYHVPDLDKALREIHRVLRPNGWLFATTNGVNSMRELRELVQPIASELPFVTNDLAATFGMENGVVLLGRHFSDVTARHYDDALEVTEVEPLMDYVLSVRGAREVLTPRRINRLRETIARCIRAKGSLHITKAGGMLVARK